MAIDILKSLLDPETLAKCEIIAEDDQGRPIELWDKQTNTTYHLHACYGIKIMKYLTRRDQANDVFNVLKISSPTYTATAIYSALDNKKVAEELNFKHSNSSKEITILKRETKMLIQVVDLNEENSTSEEKPPIFKAEYIANGSPDWGREEHDITLTHEINWDNKTVTYLDGDSIVYSTHNGQMGGVFYENYAINKEHIFYISPPPVASNKYPIKTINISKNDEYQSVLLFADWNPYYQYIPNSKKINMLGNTQYLFGIFKKKNTITIRYGISFIYKKSCYFDNDNSTASDDNSKTIKKEKEISLPAITEGNITSEEIQRIIEYLTDRFYNNGFITLFLIELQIFKEKLENKGYMTPLEFDIYNPASLISSSISLTDIAAKNDLTTLGDAILSLYNSVASRNKLNKEKEPRPFRLTKKCNI